MQLISITRLRIRSWQFLLPFFYYSAISAWQARNAPGNLSVTLLKDTRMTFWTRTIWIDESAMKAFMTSGHHRRAMPKLLEFCDEASVGRWTQNDGTLPAWDEIHRRMQMEGRPSKVNHPSDDHRAYKIAAPKVRRLSQVRLK